MVKTIDFWSCDLGSNLAIVDLWKRGLLDKYCHGGDDPGGPHGLRVPQKYDDPICKWNWKEKIIQKPLAVVLAWSQQSA